MQSMQPPMGGMPNQGSMYGPGPNMMPPGMPGVDMPKTDLDESPVKGKKGKKERKPRESKAGGKGKKGKKANDLLNLDQEPLPPEQNVMSHEVYEFQDMPSDIPEKKTKKPR